jgi:hypothetical protein
MNIMDEVTKEEIEAAIAATPNLATLERLAHDLYHQILDAIRDGQDEMEALCGDAGTMHERKVRAALFEIILMNVAMRAACSVGKSFEASEADMLRVFQTNWDDVAQIDAEQARARFTVIGGGKSP